MSKPARHLQPVPDDAVLPGWDGVEAMASKPQPKRRRPTKPTPAPVIQPVDGRFPIWEQAVATRFTRVPNEIFRFADMGLPQSASRLFQILLARVDWRDPSAALPRMTESELCAACGYESRNTLLTARDELVRIGFISVIRVSRKLIHYAVNLDNVGARVMEIRATYAGEGASDLSRIRATHCANDDDDSRNPLSTNPRNTRSGLPYKKERKKEHQSRTELRQSAPSAEFLKALGSRTLDFEVRHVGRRNAESVALRQVGEAWEPVNLYAKNCVGCRRRVKAFEGYLADDGVHHLSHEMVWR